MKTNDYNVDRALLVAIEMGKIGKTFYESLAISCGDSQLAELAAKLTKAETSHIV